MQWKREVQRQSCQRQSSRTPRDSGWALLGEQSSRCGDKEVVLDLFPSSLKRMLLKRECLIAQGVPSNSGEGRSRAGVDIQTLADKWEAGLVSSLPLDSTPRPMAGIAQKLTAGVFNQTQPQLCLYFERP